MPFSQSGSGGGSSVGALLAVVSYGPAVLATYNVNAVGAPVALDTTNLTVSFTVPSTGNAVVSFNANMGEPGASQLTLALLNHSGGAQVGQTVDNVLGAAASPRTYRMHVVWYLTGLSAGTTLGLDIAGSVGSAATGHVYAMGHTGASADAKTGPAVIMVQSA